MALWFSEIMNDYSSKTQVKTQTKANNYITVHNIKQKYRTHASKLHSKPKYKQKNTT